VPDDEPYVVLMQAGLVAEFRDWLSRHGLEMRRAPGILDAPNVHLVTPTDEMMRRKRRGES
jgi:hypothetical protein